MFRVAWTALRISTTAREVSNTNNFPDANQLAIICDEFEMPEEVKLLKGIHPTNGQIFMRFDQSTQYYYMPRRVVLGDETRLFPNVTADTPNVGLLGAICKAAGFAEPLSPGLRLLGQQLAAEMATAMPVGWGLSAEASCAAGACRPASIFQTHPIYSEAFTGDLLTFPLAVDCYAAETAKGQYNFRLYNMNSKAVSTLAGIVQAQLVTSRHTTGWGTVYEPKKNNFALRNAICRSVSPSNDNGVASRVRGFRDVRSYTVNDYFWRYDTADHLAPVAFEGMDCPDSIIAPPYRFTDASLASHANRAINMTRDCRPRSPLVWTVEPSTNVLALSCQTMSLTHNNLAGFSFSSTSGLDTRLEVSYFGTPAMVCTRNVNALRLMCRQAGYSSHFAFLNTEVSKGYYYPPSSYNYNYGSTSYERARSFLYNLRCSDDNATDLSSCEYDHFEVEDCDDNFAIVKCLDVPPSSGWRFRLNRHGVRGGSAGALEVLPAPNLQWGSAWYSYSFANERFDVDRFTAEGERIYFPSTLALPVSICRHLGFADAVNAVFYWTTTPFGQGTGPVWFPNMECPSYTDFNITGPDNPCTDNQFAYDYSTSHYSDVNIDCYPAQMLKFPSWEVRTEAIAEPGRDLYRVLVRENTSMPWGSVTYERPGQYSYYDASYYPLAESVCRLAGRPIDNRAVALDYSGSFVGNSSLGIVGHIKSCPSDMKSILDCTWDRKRYRLWWESHSSDLVVDCDYKPGYPRDQWQFSLSGGTSGDLRFATSPTSAVYNGCVNSIGYNEVLLAVCNPAGHNFHRRLASNDAQMLTTPLPFSKEEYRSSSRYTIGNAVCRGWHNETLSDCYFTGYSSSCSSYYTRTLNCDPGSLKFSLFEYRLVTDGFDNDYTGRIEFRPDEYSPWGAIQHLSGFSDGAKTRSEANRIASLACASVNLPAANASTFFMPFKDRPHITDEVPEYTDNVNLLSCRPNATSLVDCMKHLSQSLTYSYQDQGEIEEQNDVQWLHVICAPNPKHAVPSQFAVRLMRNVEPTHENASLPANKWLLGHRPDAAGGPSTTVGIPEMRAYDGGDWGSICMYRWEVDRYWDSEGAVSTCGSLGFKPSTGDDDYYFDWYRPKVPGGYNESLHIGTRPFFIYANELYNEIDAPLMLNGTRATFDFFSHRARTLDTVPSDYEYNTEPPRFTHPILYDECRGSQYALAVVCHDEHYYYNKSDFEFRAVEPDHLYYAKRIRLEMRPSKKAPWGTISGYSSS